MCAHSPVLKDDQGNLGINGLRPEENGFRLLNAFVKRIGESDSPSSGFRINFYPIGWQLLQPNPTPCAIKD